ncbi:glycosyltransferase family 71 protein [Baudoinia panamericana UAMH 10762]|uniref:Glycosyltransferase family 71 protein n=1 Tax=Baudoinia panamericana (strain UAMH 10762) TaxID=717646 RepID=M2MF07_BAUPA|nr:glycosyltransferase family 71 protein [Baudoinia panamericana UAMH 10762]EMC95196.1 glycosyltransferase family 71 protein [Baudoinia panamericana UAMH 10762]
MPQEEAVPFLGISRQGHARLVQNARAWLSRVTRKQAFVAVGTLTTLLILVSLAHPSSPARSVIASSTGILPTVTTSTSSQCGLDWPNSKGIRTPINVDVKALTSFWPELSRSLEQHGFDLPTLEQPPWMAAPASPEDIRDRSSLLTEDQYTLIRDRQAEFLNDIPPYPKAFKGRGIIMLAGGSYSEYAVTSLGVLRGTGCKLPVEVWRRDEREEKKDWCKEIESQGMVCRRLSDYLDTDLLKIADGKELKIFTMLFSSFEEILFMDADNLAIQAPEILFESNAYKETGVMLWPDFWDYDNIDWLDYAIGIADNQSEALWGTRTYESGQVLWNKKKHWKSLLLATYYNWHGPQLYYTLMNIGWAGWGDKDTFPMALRALKEPFHTVQYPPTDTWVIGRIADRRIGMIQMEPVIPQGREEAKAFFMHSTSMKWSHRDMFCVRCLPIWHTDSSTDGYNSRYEDEFAEFYNELHNSVKLMDEDARQYCPDNLDPEIKIWRAMEHAACRSKAWRHGRTCEAMRRYMMDTFGFEFEYENGKRHNFTDVPSMQDAVCLVDPI